MYAKNKILANTLRASAVAVLTAYVATQTAGSFAQARSILEQGLVKTLAGIF